MFKLEKYKMTLIFPSNIGDWRGKVKPQASHETSTENTHLIAENQEMDNWK